MTRKPFKTIEWQTIGGYTGYFNYYKVGKHKVLVIVRSKNAKVEYQSKIKNYDKLFKENEMLKHRIEELLKGGAK